MLTPEEEKTFVQMVMQVSNREIRSPGDVMRESMRVSLGTLA
jgi:hypothetical protein